MTLYAAHLSRIYYLHYGPFFDSSVYLNYLFEILEVTKANGFLAGFSKAMESGVTGLPFFQILALSPFINEPTRQLSTVIHLPWLFCFAASVFTYLLVFRQKSLLWSLATTFPFISISALWSQNGGLSDFRLDLLLYLLLSTAFTWFLATKRSLSYWPWAIMGVFAGLTFLTRATSPVYAIICIIPIVVGRLLIDPPAQRKTNLRGTLLAAAIATLLSLWFYIAKFDFLHYYYILWNVDANANLPISQSKIHIQLALWNIGRFALTAAAVAFMLALIKSFSPRDRDELSAVQRQPNWEALWLAIAPVALLVFGGAGLNPFVGMPAAFGLLMVLVDPILEIPPYEGKVTRRLSPFLLGITGFLMVTAAFQGIVNHTQPTLFPRLNLAPLYPNMASQRHLVEMVLDDIEASGKEDISLLDIPYISGISNSFLDNILKFDFRSSPTAHPAGDLLRTSNMFLIAAPVEWDEVDGDTDAEKIQTLAAQSAQELDYLILPDEATRALIAKKNPNALINLYTDQIAEAILASGQWQPISDPIHVDFDERVRLYKKVAS